MALTEGHCRLALVILACRDACTSLPHAFKRKRIFDELSLFMSLMMLCAVKKSQSYLEVMRQMELTLTDSCGWSHRPSASALSQARGKLNGVHLTLVRPFGCFLIRDSLLPGRLFAAYLARSAMSSAMASNSPSGVTVPAMSC